MATSRGARCLIEGCGWSASLLGDAGIAAFHRHVNTAHTDQGEVHQLATVDWHRAALEAVHELARRGLPFVISQVIDFGVPDAPNPRTDWARIQREAEGLGWIEPTGRLGHSTRPTTKGSPVTEWIGTYAVRRTVA